MKQLDTILNAKEQAIYDGLMTIRPEIAAFYKDGVCFKQMDFLSKSNVLGHLLREIDGGLRSIFESKKKKEDIKKAIDDVYYEKLFNEFKNEYSHYEYLRDVNVKDIKQSGHISSIVSSFGYSPDSNIAKRYIKLSIWFNKYAHRDDKSIERPRNPHDIILIWDEFEDILYQLVGTYIVIITRLDTLTQTDIPNETTLDRLDIILSDESKSMYFYSHLDSVEWLQPLYEKGKFDGKSNPNPIESKEHPGCFSYPYWHELQYVCRMAHKIAPKEKEKWKTICNIIDSVLGYRSENGEKIVNLRTNDMLIELISTLPDEYLSSQHLTYVEEIINTGTALMFSFKDKLIPKFLETGNKKAVLKSFDLLFSSKKNKTGYPEHVPVFDLYSYKSFIKDKLKKIVDICGVEGYRILLDKLKSIQHWSFLPSMNVEDEQNRYNNDYEDLLVFYLIDYVCNLPAEDQMVAVKELFNESEMIYKRIAYYIIGRNYAVLKGLLWNQDKNPLNDIQCYPELYSLMEQNCFKFSREELHLCKKWIEDLILPEGEGQKNLEDDILSLRKMYVLALAKIREPEISAYVESVCMQYPHEIDHPGYLSYVTEGITAPASSPKDNIQNMSLSEIVELYKEHEKEGISLPIDIGRQELSSEFTERISKVPDKYDLEIYEMQNAPMLMVYDWSCGLIKYLNEHRGFRNAEVIFSTFQKLFNENFWIKYNSAQSNFDIPHWLVNNFLMLAGRYMERAYNNITSAVLQVIKDTLLLVKQEAQSIYEKPWDGNWNSMYNRHHENLYECLIRVTFLSAKKEYKEESHRWYEDIKEILDADISLGENADLFYAIASFHNEIIYIDQFWFYDKLNIIFDVKCPSNYKAALYGYHLHHPLSNLPVFKYLYDNGIYTDILDHIEEQDSIIAETVIGNLLEAIRMKLLGDEELSTICGRDSKTICEYLMKYLWRLRDDKSCVEFVNRIWSFMYQKYKNSNGEEETSALFIKESYRLIGFFETIDGDREEKMLASVNQNCEYGNSWQIIECLCPFLQNSSAEVAHIVNCLIQSSSDNYHNPKLKDIVEYLYANEYKSEADLICNECVKKEDYSLRPVYEKNNPIN